MAARANLDDLAEGMKLQAHFDGTLYKAKVLTVSTAKRRARAPVKVQWLGYGKEWDSWVPLTKLVLPAGGKAKDASKRRSYLEPSADSLQTMWRRSMALGDADISLTLVHDAEFKASVEQKRTDASKLSAEASFTEEYCKCVMVTGGAGFVGSHVCEALLKEGRRVVLYDVFNSETTQSSEKKGNAALLEKIAEENASKGAYLKVVTGDFRDQPKLLKTISEEGVTGCIHIGGMVHDRRSVQYPEEYINVNIFGTAVLFDALGKSGVRMVVQASTRSVFGQRSDNHALLDESADRRPINPYGASKVGADAMAHCYSHLHNMNVTLLRLFSVYGPRGRPDMIPRILIESVYHGNPIRKFGDGTATRTWIYISDIVSAFLLALKHPQGGFAEFNTGAPNSTTLNEMIQYAEEVCGKKAVIEHLPPPPGDAHTVGNPSYHKIRKQLGWKPVVDVHEGMKKTYDDFVESQKA